MFSTTNLFISVATTLIMIQTIRVKREELSAVIQFLTKHISEPLFRGLSEKAQREYQEEGKLIPKSGSVSVGEGVFFSSSLQNALYFAKGILLNSSRKQLDAEGQVVDTRIPEYDSEIRARLNQKLGKGNYSGWKLWEEIQKQDTITYEGGARENYVYTRRLPVEKSELIAEIKFI